MTPQEIAARLPELTGGPYDDATITALAQITAESIRALNHATFPPAGPTEPVTVNRMLAELASAAHRLPQLFAQLTRWLAAENSAGRLADDGGEVALTVVLHGAQTGLGDAGPLASQLADALDQATWATAGLYRPGQDGEDP